MSPAYLHERLRYDPATGKLWWREHPAMRPQWNSRWAGREAFTALTTNGYRNGCIDRRYLLAHRVIWAMHYGTWPEKVDHEDHDRAHNRLGNLRDTSNTGNQRNQSKHRNNTSGVTGVCWDQRTQQWAARIGVQGCTLNLGRFDSFDDAVAARRAAEAKHTFHPNHGK